VHRTGYGKPGKIHGIKPENGVFLNKILLIPECKNR
jgi:hypothetical protein